MCGFNSRALNKKAVSIFRYAISIASMNSNFSVAFKKKFGTLP
jgi:hypothetical protein